MSRRGIELNHVLIYVSDLSRAVRFYRELLGLQIVEEDKGYTRLRSSSGTSTIGLHALSKSVRSTPPQEGVRLYFEVRKLDELCRSLARSGVKFDQMAKKMPWGWRHAYLRDPDGHEISLYWAGEKRLGRSKT